jgi:predicted nucleic acid-binding protein
MSNNRPIAVVDTDVVSYLLKGAPIAWEYHSLLRGYQPTISFVTAAELQLGAARRQLGPRRLLHLDLLLAESPILPFKPGMERTYALLMAQRERMGRPMDKADAWIAATAIFHNAPLATHDVNFAVTPGLRIITASKEARAAQVRLPSEGRQPLNLDMRCQCSA